jgi:RNA polymerase sigma factor for flagellar operon FliA
MSHAAHLLAQRYAPSEPALSDEELVKKHLSMIERQARRISARTGHLVEPGDLFTAGALGLLEARRRFDPARGVKFETFVEHRVRGAMADELRNLDHLPRRLRAETEALQKAKKKLSHERGREVGTDELAAELNQSAEDVAALQALSEPALSLTPELPMPSYDEPADVQLAKAQLKKRLADAIASLPARLALLMSLYYVEGLTYKEIAEALEVTEARVCQLHGQAVKELRATFAAES